MLNMLHINFSVSHDATRTLKEEVINKIQNFIYRSFPFVICVQYFRRIRDSKKVVVLVTNFKVQSSNKPAILKSALLPLLEILRGELVELAFCSFIQLIITNFLLVRIAVSFFTFRVVTDVQDKAHLIVFVRKIFR